MKTSITRLVPRLGCLSVIVLALWLALSTAAYAAAWNNSPGYLKITSPPGSTTTVWESDSTQTIAWQGAGPLGQALGPVKISLKKQSNLQVVATLSVSSAGPSVNYKVSKTLESSSPYVLVIESKNFPKLTDSRLVVIKPSAAAAASPGSLSITSPAAGGVWIADSVQTIAWQGSGPGGQPLGPVSIILWKHTGQFVATLASAATGSSITYRVPKELAGPNPYNLRVVSKNFPLYDAKQLTVTAGQPPAAASPLLTGATITFNTTQEKKDSPTSVAVSIKNESTSRGVAFIGWTAGPEYKANTQSTLNLSLYPNTRKSDCANLATTVVVKANGSDTWSFHGMVTLKFADGSQMTTGSANQYIMHSNQSQEARVRLGAPAGHIYSSAGQQPAQQPATGLARSLLIKCTNINDPRYSMNYYNAGRPSAAPLPPANAKITAVRNASNSKFILWLYDKGQVASPDIPLSPGQSTAAFNGKKLTEVSWGAAMSAPYPIQATLEVQWSVN